MNPSVGWPEKLDLQTRLSTRLHPLGTQGSQETQYLEHLTPRPRHPSKTTA